MTASPVIGCSSGHHLANGGLIHEGANVEYQRVLCSVRHWFSGLSTTVVSTMLRGAGSVAVSDLPIFPYTLWISGNWCRSLSWICRYLEASVTPIPGSVMGI